MKRITQRQRVLLGAIRLYIHENGYCPTQRELAQRMDCHPRAIQEMLNRLKQKGFVTWVAGRARSLRTIRNGEKPNHGLEAPAQYV